jgi:hypothetical protein
MAANEHATIKKLLEAVFSEVCTMAIGTQQRGKHISVATVELQD